MTTCRFEANRSAVTGVIHISRFNVIHCSKGKSLYGVHKVQEPLPGRWVSTRTHPAKLRRKNTNCSFQRRRDTCTVLERKAAWSQVPTGVRKQEWLCWRGPAAIYLTPDNNVEDCRLFGGNVGFYLTTRRYIPEIVLIILISTGVTYRPRLWSSRQISYLQIQRLRVRIPDTTRFSDWNGVHSRLLSTIEELLGRRSSASGLKSENTAVGIRYADHVAPSIRQSWHKLSR
jgi:hypothetical protein